MRNVAVRPGVGALALAGMSVASAAVIAAVPTMSQAATIADKPVTASSPARTALSGSTGIAALASEAAVDPAGIYADAVERALANIKQLQANSSDKAFPILSQVLQNQLNLITGVAGGVADGKWTTGKSPDFAALWKEATASVTDLGTGLTGAGQDVADALRDDVPPLLEAVTDALRAGDIESAMNNMLMVAVVPIFAAINPSSGPLLPALGKILDVPLDLGLALAGAVPNDQISAALSEPFNAGKRVVGQLQEVALFAGMGIISPLGGGIGALGHAVQTVVDGVAAGDMDAVASALLQAPGVMLDGLLNGGYGPSVGDMIGLGDYPVVNGGLLGPKLNITFDDGEIKIFLPGTLGALQYIQGRIAHALAPQSSSTSSYTVDSSAVASSPVVATSGEKSHEAADSASAASDSAVTSDSTITSESTSVPESAVPSNSPSTTSTSDDPASNDADRERTDSSSAESDNATSKTATMPGTAATDTPDAGISETGQSSAGDSASEKASPESATPAPSDSADAGSAYRGAAESGRTSAEPPASSSASPTTASAASTSGSSGGSASD